MTEGLVMSEVIHVRMHPELRRRVIEEAAKRYPDSVSDFVCTILADKLEVPDLARVPRRRMGRPPKNGIAKNGHKKNGKKSA